MWLLAVVLLVGIVLALVAVGEAAVVPAVVAVVGVVAGVHFLVSRAFGRFLPAPDVPADASPGERARIMRPYLVRTALAVAVGTAGAFAFAFASGDNGPSTVGAVYLLVPLAAVVTLLIVATLRARR